MLTTQQREIIIRLNEQKKTQQQIAAVVGCSQVTVSKWISKYKSGRTLETLPRSGRPTKLTQARLTKLRAKLVLEVKKANKKYCSLSTKELGNIIKEEVGRAYSLRHVERVMHKLGFSLVRPRPQHVRHDQKKADEFRDELKKNFGGNTWVLSS
jgi:putative transposase